MSNENTALTVEWAPFQTAGHVSDADFQRAADMLEKDFLRHQAGYVRRELLKGAEEHQWVDLIYWTSPESAATAMKAAGESEVCGQYFSMMQDMENAEPGVSHFTQVKAWN